MRSLIPNNNNANILQYRGLNFSCNFVSTNSIPEISLLAVVCASGSVRFGKVSLFRFTLALAFTRFHGTSRSHATGFPKNLSKFFRYVCRTAPRRAISGLRNSGSARLLSPKDDDFQNTYLLHYRTSCTVVLPVSIKCLTCLTRCYSAEDSQLNIGISRIEVLWHIEKYKHLLK